MSPDLPSDAVQAFLPTLERAREADLPLPKGEPTSQERWSALYVIATILRRTTWKEEILQHEANVAHIARSAPPVPSVYVPATHVTVESVHPFGACPECIAFPGYRPCRICKGLGEVWSGPRWEDKVRCSCAGGRVPCPSCRGTAITNRVLLRYFEDAPASMRELLLPSHLRLFGPFLGLESAMEGTAGMEQDPPEELRCHDLTGRTGGSAYRGGVRVVRPTFHGHDYGDTIDRSIEALRALGGGAHVVLHQIRAYAWPLLRLTYPNARKPEAPREVAIYPDRTGALRAYGDTER